MTAAARLQTVCAAANLPVPELEYHFHPARQFRFDAAWPAYKLALEIEGGIWLQTKTGRSKGHAHPARFLADIEKYNEAAILGWRLIRITPKMLDRSREIRELVRRALQGAL